MLNVAVVVLLATAKLVISVFFGELRAIEAQRMYQRLVELMVLKVIIFMELVPRTFVDLSTWLAWFGSLAYVRIFVLLCCDRFEFVRALSSISAAFPPSALTFWAAFRWWERPLVTLCRKSGGSARSWRR